MTNYEQFRKCLGDMTKTFNGEKVALKHLFYYRYYFNRG